MPLASRAIALVGCAAAVAGAVTTASASASSPHTVPTLSGPRHVMYQGSIRPHNTSGVTPKVIVRLPTFHTSVLDGGTRFSYTLVGKNPAVAQTHQSTTVQTVVVPLKIVLGNGHTYDPTVGTGTCDTTPALTRVTSSPVFVSRSWTFNGQPIGTAQYVDAFRRSEFNTYTNPSGINPAYHVRLSKNVQPVVTVNVPLADSAEGTISCGSGKEGAVEINWFDNYLNTTLLPALTSAGTITPKAFPLFVTNNVIWYQNVTSNCCILGYHSATGSANTSQTYGVADYESGDFFGTAIQDIEATTHEVAEWMDDPFVNNATKPWGNIGQVSGCQSNLEVGDPLTGTTIPRTVNGKTYHVQELAYFSWFYHQNPSLGAGGKYSNHGSFTTSAAPCP